jgi:aspartate-semialdehyde dehydrogenase
MTKIGIVGVSGLVGQEILKLLHDRNFNVTLLRLFGTTDNGMVTKFTLKEARIVDIIFLCTPASFSKTYAKQLTEGDGPKVIDMSSAYRLDKDIPLVIPEINGHLIGSNKIIACSNCTTAICAMVLYPLHKEFKIKKLIMSTYQATSGAGKSGLSELKKQTTNVLTDLEDNHNHKCIAFDHPIAFNVIPHIDDFEENGYTKEEMKVVHETRRIFDDPDINISCTAVRVPTCRAHAISITMETEEDISDDEARFVLSDVPGVIIKDDVHNNIYPMLCTATENDLVEVGRIRQSLIFGNKGIDLFICGDQLLRGAALNSVLIAEQFLKC